MYKGCVNPQHLACEPKHTVEKKIPMIYFGKKDGGSVANMCKGFIVLGNQTFYCKIFLKQGAETLQ